MTTPLTVSWIIQQRQQQQQKHLLVQKKLYGVDINTKKKQLQRKGAQPLRHNWANWAKGLGQAEKRYA